MAKQHTAFLLGEYHLARLDELARRAGTSKVAVVRALIELAEPEEAAAIVHRLRLNREAEGATGQVLAEQAGGSRKKDTPQLNRLPAAAGSGTS